MAGLNDVPPILQNIAQQLGLIAQGVDGGLKIVPPPAHSGSAGTAGMIAVDATYFYFCYATNAWGRVAFGAPF